MKSVSDNAKQPILTILPWLDILALLAWGSLLLKYAVTGQLKLLIHPNYAWLTITTGIIFIIIAIAKIWQLLPLSRTVKYSQTRPTVEHITLLPQGWGSSLLILTAIAGFLIAPTILASQSAIQRGLTETLPITRTQPQAFRTSTKPEDRTIIDWVRTLNAYPEPDAYTGQKAKLSGFVVHLPQLPDNYLMISRFIITCCAVDAYPVGLPVKLEGSRQQYPPDTWLQIEGTMISETLAVANPENNGQKTSNQRQLVISAQKIEKIPTPPDPYGY